MYLLVHRLKISFAWIDACHGARTSGSNLYFSGTFLARSRVRSCRSPRDKFALPQRNVTGAHWLDVSHSPAGRPASPRIPCAVAFLCSTHHRPSPLPFYVFIINARPSIDRQARRPAGEVVVGVGVGVAPVCRALDHTGGPMRARGRCEIANATSRAPAAKAWLCPPAGGSIYLCLSWAMECCPFISF